MVMFLCRVLTAVHVWLSLLLTQFRQQPTLMYALLVQHITARSVLLVRTRVLVVKAVLSKLMITNSASQR